MTPTKKTAVKKTVAKADAPIVAPPSPQAVVVGAASQLPAGLAQAEVDLQTLADLLANWPADLPVDLQPVVEILERVVQSMVLLAQASAGMAAHSGLV